jgi:hypothetical protein
MLGAMKILKTYARLWVRDLDESLPTLRAIVGRDEDLRFAFGDVELAAIGDFLVIAGTPEALEPLRDGVGPVIVERLDDALSTLAEIGAEIIEPVAESATGRFLYARHPDGSKVEYVEWKPELVDRILHRRP